MEDFVREACSAFNLQQTGAALGLHAPVELGAHCRIGFMSTAYLQTQPEVHCRALFCTGAGKSSDPTSMMPGFGDYA